LHCFEHAATNGIAAPQVEKLHDEGVQLKMLQTALTLLQSPVHAHLEVWIQQNVVMLRWKTPLKTVEKMPEECVFLICPTGQHWCGAGYLLPAAGDITQFGQRRQHSCSNRQTGDAGQC
jgi:hypothetical protein